jgi:hypothetical protein
MFAFALWDEKEKTLFVQETGLAKSLFTIIIRLAN